MNQPDALDILKMGHNVFLTGPPGSGKTYILNRYIDYLKKNKVPVAVTASTGVGATHLNGRTIHSWSGSGIKESLSKKEIKSLLRSAHLVSRIQGASTLIIDEVSMLHSYRFDLVDRICREVRKSIRPFGGLQVICSGDFFQLPPVQTRETQSSKLVVESHAWNEMDISICYLDEQHRHVDVKLVQILNNIRNNTVTEKTIKELLSRMDRGVLSDIAPAKLYTHNKDVDAINEWELDKIDSEKKEYVMRSEGNEKLVQSLKKSCLAPEILTLKEGAKVMFIKNNFGKGYVNGTLGKIVGFDEDNYPIVKTFSNKRITALPASWSIEDENGYMQAQIAQVPLRLAWAVTIHKSQGMTLDAAEIDLSKAFEEGMGYVAISRVRSLDNIKLRGLNETSLKVSERALLLDSGFIDESAKMEEYIGKIKKSEKEKAQREFLKKNRREKTRPDLEEILNNL